MFDICSKWSGCIFSLSKFCFEFIWLVRTMYNGKGLLQVPSPVSLATNYPLKYGSQSKQKFKVAIDECSFCRAKGHWKHQCPWLVNKESHVVHRLNDNHKDNVVSIGTNSTTYVVHRPHVPSMKPTDMSLLGEQFQKYLSTHQPNVFAKTSLGWSSLFPSGMSSAEAEYRSMATSTA